MAKKRVHEIAKERGMSSKEVIAKLQAAGFEVKAAASSIEESDAAKALGANGSAPGAPRRPPPPRAGHPPAPRQARPRPQGHAEGRRSARGPRRDDAAARRPR